MKPLTQYRLIPAGALFLLAFAAGFWMSARQQPSYRDLDKNGKMDVYEDRKQPIEKRVSDLLQQMTLEEKAGMLFINGAFIKEDGSLDPPAAGMMSIRMPATIDLVNDKKRTHY